jgi:hypothetical protein
MGFDDAECSIQEPPFCSFEQMQLVIRKKKERAACFFLV